MHAGAISRRGIGSQLLSKRMRELLLEVASNESRQLIVVTVKIRLSIG